MSINVKKTVLSLIAVTGLVTAASNAFAQQHERPRTPPPEAIEACDGQSEGDSVSFESPHGDTLEGVCAYVDEQLVAVPENRGRRHD
ncbi:hypothetical protein [Mesonia mobilis]|uniref:hypothetical protein n=1 Tax=Mesonia mobilis TaxID=369791 RepID=UPI0026EDE401|nr:hypothetical protein [Mesonia mobilis]